MSKLNYLVTKNAIDVYYQGKQYHLENTEKTKKDFLELFSLLTSNKTFETYEEIKQVLEISTRIKLLQEKLNKYLADSGEQIEIKNGIIYYKDTILKSEIVDKILQIEKAGGNPKAFINFIDKVMQNPSTESINEMYLFLDHNKLPICENGNFLAYKKINADWTDIHTFTISNHPDDAIPMMERSKVDPDRNKTCSFGYHVCGYNYLQYFGSNNPEKAKVVMVEVNPADVVTVPADYDNAKMRVTWYKVICEIENWKSIKIRDYYASDSVNAFESWENYIDNHNIEDIYRNLEDNYEKWLQESEYIIPVYIIPVDNEADEYEDDYEDFLDEDDEDDWLASDDDEYSNMEDDDYDNENEEEDNTPRKVWYKVNGSIYEGYLLNWITAGVDAREEWKRMKERDSFVKEILEDFRCESVIKNRVSRNDRVLVMVIGVNSMPIEPYKITTPTVETLRKYNKNFS